MNTNSGDSARSSAKPRYQRGVRDQIKIEMRSLDQQLPANHVARLAWAFVQKLDLSEYYARIKAVEGGPGRSAVDPAILIALWLLATIDGIGSARELEERCRDDLPYQWLCGDVGVNYHLLSDFRTDDPERLDKLLVTLLPCCLRT